MDNRNILNLKRDVREMQLQHNRLTALCALLYKNIKTLKSELYQQRSGSQQQSNNPHQQQYQQQRQGFQQQQQTRDLDEIHADEILRQLSSQH
jgi:hypothetical protein